MFLIYSVKIKKKAGKTVGMLRGHETTPTMESATATGYRLHPRPRQQV